MMLRIPYILCIGLQMNDVSLSGANCLWDITSFFGSSKEPSRSLMETMANVAALLLVSSMLDPVGHEAHTYCALYNSTVPVILHIYVSQHRRSISSSGNPDISHWLSFGLTSTISAQVRLLATHSRTNN